LEPDDTLRIQVATDATRVQSLWLVFAALAADERAAQVASTIASAADPVMTFANLLIARRGQRIVAAVWIQPAPGKTAVVWPPQLVAEEPESTADALFKEVEARLAASDVELAQAVQTNDQGDDADRLRRHGFPLSAKLLYLIWDADPMALPSQHSNDEFDPNDSVVEDSAATWSTGQAEPEGTPTSLEFEPYDGANSERLAEVVERTYVETLDIPALNNMRRMDDVLDGYRLVGEYDPHNWYFVREGKDDVGCLLLANHGDVGHFELIYMGVVPEARGRGIGKRITEFAQRHTVQAGSRRLILGVDAENCPALSSYTAAGFQYWQERWVFLRGDRK